MHIVIEGNVGTNKQKFINFLLQSFLNIEENKYPNETIWESPKDKSFSNGCSFLLNRSNKLDKNSIFISNKSILSFEGYLNSCLEIGYMNEKKINILKLLYNKLKFPKIDYIIVLTSEPGYCYEKLIERKINNANPLFINNMTKTYNNILTNYKTNILEIDIEKYNLEEEIGKNELIYKISKFIPQLQKDLTPGMGQWKTITRGRKKKKSRSKLPKNK